MSEFFNPWPYNIVDEEYIEDEEFNNYLQNLLSKRLQENHPIIIDLLTDKEV